MKDLATLLQYTMPSRRLSAAWNSPLWEDFPEEGLEEEEPPLHAGTAAAWGNDNGPVRNQPA